MEKKKITINYKLNEFGYIVNNETFYLKDESDNQKCC